MDLNDRRFFMRIAVRKGVRSNDDGNKSRHQVRSGWDTLLRSRYSKEVIQARTFIATLHVEKLYIHIFPTPPYPTPQ